MRRAQKKRAEDFVKLLEQAHEEIVKEMEHQNPDAALGLLGQCQEGAISLGNLIESCEGEGTETVALLEEYCELVYQVYEEIMEGQMRGRGRSCKLLKKSLVQVRNSIRNHIKVRIEAVFLPYKAAMWDSLESIWKEADADPDCDAYVIPIPYFDKNPDGSFNEEHYEGNLYPDYVPVTRYDAFDFEAHRPDLVFIHNPYDNCNYVTSVHPFFYSANLKKYTDNLVYIPYFIKKEISPDNSSEVKKMEDYCTVFGVVNADKVIVQSEAMKEVYVNVLTKYAGENTRKYWEEKIAGLGSPKIEKVQRTRKQDLFIPDQWKKIMENRNSSRIVLYNTHLNLLMERNYEWFIPKLKETLSYFQSRDDIILLWRPHPLSLATAKSMNPHVSEVYQGIVEKYQREEWGIYDDTPDLERAIALSDAYYGSESSLLALYEAVRKPILIHKINIVEEEEW